eukprot:719631_1
MYVNTYSHYAVYIISIKPTIVHLLLSPAHFARRINMKSEISIILFIYAIIDMVLHHEIGLYHHGIRSYLFILTTVLHRYMRSVAFLYSIIHRYCDHHHLIYQLISPIMSCMRF